MKLVADFKNMFEVLEILIDFDDDVITPSAEFMRNMLVEAYRITPETIRAALDNAWHEGYDAATRMDSEGGPPPPPKPLPESDITWHH